MDSSTHSMRTTKSQEWSLREVELFQGCSEHLLQNVYALSKQVSYLRGEVLKTAGSKYTHMCVVISGDVRIVDGMDTVLHKNHVVGIYSQINDLGIYVYTAYAARNGATCMRISRKSLNAIFNKYPQDKRIIMLNCLKFVNRRPRAHILAAMRMQVDGSANQFTGHHMTKKKPVQSSHSSRPTHSKSSPSALGFTASTNAHSAPAIEMVRSNSFACRQNKIYPEIVRKPFEFPASIYGHLILESVFLLLWVMVIECVTLVMSCNRAGVAC